MNINQKYIDEIDLGHPEDGFHCVTYHIRCAECNEIIEDHEDIRFHDIDWNEERPLCSNKCVENVEWMIKEEAHLKRMGVAQ